MKPLISVIVPVYNVEKVLTRCIESILSQSYRNLEIILVDDGSPDNCPSICDEYSELDSRIIVIHQQNKGLSGARNAGIDISKGSCITFVDSDDYIEPKCIETMEKNLSEFECDISCIKHNVIYKHRIINEWTGNKYLLGSKEALEMILYSDDMDVSAWGKLYKKHLFDQIRYPEGRLFEDTATTYRLINKANKVYLDSLPLYNYIIRDNSITNNRFSSDSLHLITSTKEMTDFIRKEYPVLNRACDRRMIYSYLSCLRQTLNTDNVKPETKQMLISYIRKNGSKVLTDGRAPLRDKVGIISAECGYDFFKLSWMVYNRLRLRNNG